MHLEGDIKSPRLVTIRTGIDKTEARASDAWYRTRRFLRRHWLSAAAATLVMACLSAGLYVADRQRAIADRRFADVRDLANQYFDIDVQVAQLPGGSKIRQLIVDTALEYLRRVTADVRMDPELALEVGTAYMRVARVQGVNISANLGQTEQADQTEQQAQGLIDSVLASRPRDRTALLRAAQIAHDRMILAGDGRRDDDALRFARTSGERLEQYLRTEDLNRGSNRLEAQQVIITHINVANRYLQANQLDEAIRICRRAIDIARATNWPAQAGSALMIVALAHRARGDLDQALQAIQESVQILEPQDGEKALGKVRTFALALVREGQILGEDNSISLNRPGEAVACLERALRIDDDFARRDPSDFGSQYSVFLVETKLAGILRYTQPRRALEMYDDGLQRLALAKGNAGSPRNEVRALAASTYPLLKLGRRAEARKRLDAVFERLGQLKLYPAERIEPGSEADDALRALADYEAGSGNPGRAAAIYQELLDGVLAANPKPETDLSDAVELSSVYRAAVRLFRNAGRTDLAAALDARRLELWQRWNRKSPDNLFVRRQLEAAMHPVTPVK